VYHAVAVPRRERAYEKYAWVIPLVLAFLHGARGALPELSRGSLEEGLVALYLDFLIAATALTGFRMGQRWGWYFMLSILVFVWIDGVAIMIEPVSFVFSLFLVPTLLLPYRKFFPKKQAVTS